MPRSDEILAQACVKGDPAAWRAFVDRYGRLVLHVVRRTADRYGARLGEAEADDLCAEVFHALLRDGAAKLRAYDPRWALSTYLGAVARSVAIDALRARRAAGGGAAEACEETSVGGPVTAAADPGPAPAEALDRSEAARAVDGMLDSLAPRERLVVRLFYYGGFKYREIAEMLGIPLNTVCSTLARALDKLRERLRGRDGRNGSPV